MANPLHDNPRSPKNKKRGPYSEPVDPESLADDAGDMSLSPKDAQEKFRKLGKPAKDAEKD